MMRALLIAAAMCLTAAALLSGCSDTLHLIHDGATCALHSAECD